MLNTEKEMPFEIKSGAPDIDPGSYRATLTGVRAEHTDKWGGSDFYIWDWAVEVPGREELVDFSDSTGIATSPGSKTYERLEALTGQAPKIGETIMDPVGKMVMLTLVKKENGFPKVAAVVPYVKPATVDGSTPA